MSQKLGRECKLYLMEGGYGSGGSWVEVDLVKDLTLNDPDDKAEVTTRRDGGFKTHVQGLRDVTVTFNMADDPADSAYQLLQNAKVGRVKVGVAIMDGAITGAASGLVADMAVFKFDRTENLSEGVERSVELAPTFSANAPYYMDAGATGTGTET